MITKANAKRIALAGGVFMASSSAARANDVMYSMAAMPVVLPVFLVWFMAGMIILRRNRDFAFLGYGSLIAFLFFAFGMGHPEIALTMWTFYLALLTVYYLFPREGVSREARQLNLKFHGSFLMLVVAGGLTAKILILSHLGRFTRWVDDLREIAPYYLVLYLILLGVVIAWLYIKITIKKRIAQDSRGKSE